MRIFTVLFIISFQTFAQNAWPIVRINEKFSVRMPSNYVVLDSMGMVLHRAESDLGTVLVLEVGRGSVDIRDKKALIKEYDAIQKGMLAQMGKFYADTTYELKGFQVRQVTTRVPNQTFPKRQVVVLLSHEEIMYAFTCIYQLSASRSPERDGIFP
jgi:hypothetical protein